MGGNTALSPQPVNIWAFEEAKSSVLHLFVKIVSHSFERFNHSFTVNESIRKFLQHFSCWQEIEELKPRALIISALFWSVYIYIMYIIPSLPFWRIQSDPDVANFSLSNITLLHFDVLSIKTSRNTGFT